MESRSCQHHRFLSALYTNKLLALADIGHIERHLPIMQRFLLILVFLLIAVEPLTAIEFQWERTFPESEAPYFVRLDASGNVYVIGRYYVESPENAEVFVKKYLPDSTLVWSDTTSGTDLKLPIAAQVDAQGNVYVLAQYAYQNVSPIIVYRFNHLTGDVDWDETFLPAGNFKQSAARDLVIDANGNVVVCANFIIDNPAQPQRSDIRSFLLRYSSAGTLLWQREDALAEPSVGFERLGTAANTIYVVGTALAQNNDVDGFVAGYNLSGDSLWTNYSGLDPQNGVFVQGHAVGGSGNFLVVFTNLNSSLFKKFSPSGTVLYTKTGQWLGFNVTNAICSGFGDSYYWVAYNTGGQQLLQGFNPIGNSAVDLVLGNLPAPFPIKFSGSNTLLTWSTGNRAAQYSADGDQLWLSNEVYSSVGDFASTNQAASYWILYVYDDVIPDLLYRKLVRYDFSSGCGDVDGSGSINISDVVYFINYIFNDGPVPKDRFQGDFDCTGGGYIGDVVFLLNYLFNSGPEPCAGCP